MKKNHFESLRLIPTQFKLDVWINWNKKESLCKKMSSRYGIGYDFLMGDISQNEVSTVTTSDDCELPNKQLILLILHDDNDAVLVHEIEHIFQHIAKICGLGIDYDSQEWIAYFKEYLFEEIKKIRD